MKKVLHYVSKMDRAGQETFIMNVFRHINRDKVKFDFLCTVPGVGDYDSEIRELGGKIRHIKLNRINNKFKHIDNVFLLYFYLRKYRNEYDVFQIHTQHAMDAFFSSVAAKLAGIHKVVVHSHNTYTLYNVPLHRMFKFFLNYLPIDRFACSRAAGKWMFGKSKFQIINNGIELSKFKFDTCARDVVREKMGWRENFVIGHVGRFNGQKNHQFLVETFEKLNESVPNLKLVLIGKGEEEEKIKNEVNEFNLENVEFLGTREDIADLYQGMDLFLFPSLFEGLPVVLVEAQANTLPCVISDRITSEICINSNIYRLPIDSAKRWSEFIVDNLLDGRADDISNNLEDAGYSIQRVSSKLERYYLR
ncbi:glycosyltransferase [Lactobacillus sp. AN1001]